MLTKDTAVCIRAVDYSETSQIVTFFARGAGKIKVIAKGSKRPKSAFDGAIEVFSHGRIVFTDSRKEGLATLTEFEQQASLANLSKNLFALNCALFVVELVNQLTDEYDPHPELFDSLEQFLQDVCGQGVENDGRRRILALLVFFQLTLLREVGLQPILNACVNCKNKFGADWSGSYFSSSANGLVCRDCEGSFTDKVKLKDGVANCLGDLKLIADSTEETLNEIEGVLVYHFTELLGRRPKMAKFVLKN